MDLRHLRYFVAVAEELHFARAAARLGIEQSPLSRQIQDLELDLKVRLLERTPRATSLTKAGERFLADARRVLEDVDGSVRALRAFANGGHPVRLGLAEGLAGSAFGRLLRISRDAQPPVAVVLVEGALSELVNLMGRGGLDAVLAPEAVASSELESTRAWAEPLALVSPPVGAESGGPIWLKSCADETIILPDPQALPGSARQIERLLQAKGLSAAGDLVAATPATLVRLVATGLGVGLLPTSLAPVTNDVAFRALKDSDAVITTWLTVRRKGAAGPLHGLVRAAAEEAQLPFSR